MRLHGARAVNDAGERALGYPALLATSPYEFRAIEGRMTRQEAQPQVETKS